MVNWQEGRDSERDNYHASGFQESPKTNQGKVQMSFSNEDYCTSSVAANGGCLALLRSLYHGKTIEMLLCMRGCFPCFCLWFYW